MYHDTHNAGRRDTAHPLRGLCLLILPLLAVIPLLLPATLIPATLIPATLLNAPLRADGNGSSGLGSTNSGSSTKAPKNSGGFVINLPNSVGSAQRLLYTTGFMGESLAKTYTRHLGGQLSFLSTKAGTEVTNATMDGSGRLATYGADGTTTVALLLPSKEFAKGGLVAVQTNQKTGSGSKKGPQIPTTVYFTITSDNLLLDVPAVLRAAKAGNLTDFTLRFYNLQGKQKVRLDLYADVPGDSVHLIF